MSPLGVLLQLKLATIRNSFHKIRGRSRIEFATLIFFLVGAGVGLFFFFFHSFRFFASQEPFGPILIDEAFYLFNFSLFVMFLISSGVSAYTSLFRSQEVPFLLTRPVQWSEIYFLKLSEALWHSSWSFLFITIPFMMAYGINKDTGFILFPLFCFLFYIPFVALAAMLGTLATTLAIQILPNPRRRKMALLIGIVALIYFFVRIEPQMVKEQGSIAGIMSGYLPHLGFAKNAFLPSSWVTRGILGFGFLEIDRIWGFKEIFFYFGLLISNTLFFLIPSYSAARRLYPVSFLKAQDHGQAKKVKRASSKGLFEKLLDALPWPSKPGLAFLEKDVKTFSRDPSEWSQLIIFFGLLLLYFSNLKNLEFHVLKDFWKNLVFVLNTIGTYIVLSSFSMRFVFPMLSLEGQRAWIIGIAPIRYSSLLMVKFFLGTIVSGLLTLPLVFLSGWMLEISLARVLYTTGLGFFVCVALTGLSVGMGARFPNFKSNNPSEIISGFGGSMLLVMHLTYLGLIGLLLMLSKEPQGTTFVIVAASSLLIGAVPLKIGVNTLRKMEF